MYWIHILLTNPVTEDQPSWRFSLQLKGHPISMFTQTNRMIDFHQKGWRLLHYSRPCFTWQTRVKHAFCRLCIKAHRRHTNRTLYYDTSWNFFCELQLFNPRVIFTVYRHWFKCKLFIQCTTVAFNILKLSTVVMDLWKYPQIVICPSLTFNTEKLPSKTIIKKKSCSRTHHQQQ